MVLENPREFYNELGVADSSVYELYLLTILGGYVGNPDRVYDYLRGGDGKRRVGDLVRMLRGSDGVDGVGSRGLESELRVGETRRESTTGGHGITWERGVSTDGSSLGRGNGNDGVGGTAAVFREEVLGGAAGRVFRDGSSSVEGGLSEMSGLSAGIEVAGDAEQSCGLLREPIVSVSVPKVGKWRRKNEKKKENRRKGEATAVGSNVIKEEVSWRVPRVRVVEKTEAQRTLEAKWAAENKLKIAEATRKLQLLEMQDVSEVAKLQERKVKAAGERALVQIEKSHATLAATGNVPGVVPKGGYCTTIVDDPGLSDGSTPSCTISPDSSASMSEFKELQKRCLDLEKELADEKKWTKRRGIMDKATYAQSVAEFTAGSESVLSDGLKRELDKKFGKNYEYDGRYEGKHVVRRVFDFDGVDDEDCGGLEDVY